METKHFISHRGNLTGINKQKENTIEYITAALNQGYECEIDVWFHKNEFYLGHDAPLEKITINFFLKHSDVLWIHCKNIQALDQLKKYEQINYFWHESDKYTLTSKNYIWTYPGEKTSDNSILVSLSSENIHPKVLGICSDYIQTLKEKSLKH